MAHENSIAFSKSTRQRIAPGIARPSLQSYASSIFTKGFPVNSPFMGPWTPNRQALLVLYDLHHGFICAPIISK